MRLVAFDSVRIKEVARDLPVLSTGITGGLHNDWLSGFENSQTLSLMLVSSVKHV